MERREPYIGTGTPPPIVAPRASSVPAGAIIAVLALAAVAAATYFLWPRAPAALPLDAAVPRATPPATAQPPRYPVQAEPADTPLPELKASDGPVAAALSTLVGLDAFGRMFVTENLVRNIVATVDNLPREQVSQRVNPVRAVPGLPATTGRDATLTLAPANAARYAPYMRVIEGTDTARLVAFYRRHYPLFQQAYVDLGYPDGYFNDRLVETIDDLLATPEPAGPLRLKQPKVLYEFADPQLEERSAGQKAMLRIGRESRERVKAKLREIRAAISAPPG